MSNVASRLKTRQEVVYGGLMVVLGALLWLLIVFALVAVFNSGNAAANEMVSVYLSDAVVLVLFVLISSAAYRATAFGNMILLGPEQFPELHAMVQDGAKELGLQPAPKAFLFNSNGRFNAFARRLMGGRYLFLTSALVDAENDEQVRFVIGHELGHHAAGHLNPWWHAVRLPAYAVPFLQPAYSRAREYTCDGIGMHLSKDLAASRSSLLMLGCGCGRLNGAMNCEAFLAQEAMVPPIFGWLTEIFRGHPRLTRRVAALRAERP